MNWRINSYTNISIHNGRGIAKYELSIVLLLGLLLITTTSCKEECVDICIGFTLVLDKSDCSCVCPEKLTPFTINGYVYCIEESKTHDIYVLENFNPVDWVREEKGECNPPEIFLSRIPKYLDSLESFHSEWYEDTQHFFHLEFYIRDFIGQRCRAREPFGAFVPINWFKNHLLSEIYIFGVERFFEFGFMKDIYNNLFKETSGVGVFRFSEDMNHMTFHYLGYKNSGHMHDAFYDLAPDEIFNFPYVPRDASELSYDPLYLQLIFSRLNF